MAVSIQIPLMEYGENTPVLILDDSIAITLDMLGLRETLITAVAVGGSTVKQLAAMGVG